MINLWKTKKKCIYIYIYIYIYMFLLCFDYRLLKIVFFLAEPWRVLWHCFSWLLSQWQCQVSLYPFILKFCSVIALGPIHQWVVSCHILNHNVCYDACRICWEKWVLYLISMNSNNLKVVYFSTNCTTFEATNNMFSTGWFTSKLKQWSLHDTFAMTSNQGWTEIPQGP